MGTGQLRQGMIPLLLLLKAWHPGRHVDPSAGRPCEPQLGRWVKVQLWPKGFLHDQTA